MLQGSSDSFTLKVKEQLVKRLADKVREGLSYLDTIDYKSIVDSLSTVETIYLAYSGPSFSEAAAYIMYWVFKHLAGDKNVELHTLDGLMYHIVAYTNKTTNSLVVFFGEHGSENSLLRLTDTLSVMRIPLIGFSGPMPPQVLEKYDLHLVYEHGFSFPGLELVVASSILGLLVAKEIIGKKNPRVNRLLSELRSIDENVIASLLERYLEKLWFISDVLTNSKRTIILYSPTLRTIIPIARTLWLKKAANMTDYPLPSFHPLLLMNEGIVRNHVVLVLATSVEELLLRELKLRLSQISLKPEYEEIVFATDPLSAPIYMFILLEYLFLSF
ncbi:MAG: hypothetical protein ABWW69_04715 [Pyrodictiaceae archaeon]